MSEPQARVKTKRDPASLSSEYHKAHKQLMLWSAILFIWELIGVDLSKAKDAGGNVGAVVTILKSPQAVPWALLILVGYFLFKCSVEWAQCHLDRRKVLFAKIDYTAALIVAGAAIALFIGQTISRVQLANAVEQSGRLKSTLAGMILGLPIGWLVFGVLLYRRGERIRPFLLWGFTIFLEGITAWALIGSERFQLAFLVPGMLVGVAVLTVPILFLHKRFTEVS